MQHPRSLVQRLKLIINTPPPLFSETYIDLKLPLYNDKFGSIDLFRGGFSMIWLIKLP